jgi:Xaa-Pro aminopeptidase
VLVIAEPTPALGEKPLNTFETLTLAPIDRRLIEPSMLDTHETHWLDSYHARVAATLTPLLDKADARWLAEATRPLEAR